MAMCSACGAALKAGAAFCSQCGAAAPVTANEGPRLHAPVAPEQPQTPLAPEQLHSHVGPEPAAPRAWPAREPGGPTVVERVLGGDWRPPILLALPTLVVAAGLAGLSAVTQLLTSESSSFPHYFFDVAPRTTSGWFHSLAQQVAMAFGSPLTLKQGHSSFAVEQPPLLISVAAVWVFAVLLRRRMRDEPGVARAVLAVRSVLLTVLLFTALSFLGSSSGRIVGQESYQFSVSALHVLGGTLLVFGLVAACIAARPLVQLSNKVSWIRHDDWAPAWTGAKAALTTAVSLGFALAVAAGIDVQDRHGHLTDTLRFLPRAVGHAVDLGINGWQVAMLGSIDDTGSHPHVTLSLFDRHGLEAWFFAALVIPFLSVLIGALRIRRAWAHLDSRTLSRCCYRMTLFVLPVFLVLASQSFLRLIEGGHDRGGQGPDYWLGGLYLVGWYLLLGFLAGQLLMGRSPASAGYAAPTAPSGSRAPWLLAGACALLLVGTSVAAIVQDGGKHAHGVSLSDSSGDSSDSSSSSSSSGSDAQDAEAKSTLRQLSLAEETYAADNGGTYTSDESVLDYTEPSDVVVNIARADSSGYCLTASGVDSSNYFTLDSTAGGSVADGNNC